jgi:nucleotide-binding universal stress UspA family protein
MIRINRILFPTDFSPCATQALDHALYLANKYKASLHVLHAIVLHEDDPHDPSAHFTDIAEIQQRLQDLARVEMQAAISARPDATGEVVMRQRRGISAADVILEYAALENIDLVVMGTHGHRGLGHLLLGSIAERVVRFSPCPVLTIREHEKPKPIPEVNRILVPVDYSDHARTAICHARAIAATYDASLDLFHVIEETPRPGFYDEVGFSVDLIPADAGEKAEQEMRRLYESTTGPDVEVRYHTVVGRAGPDIVGFAEETGADLIVIATHGLSALSHLLMGSVAETVVRMSPCPVCTVKSFGKSLLAGAGDARSTAVG